MRPPLVDADEITTAVRDGLISATEARKAPWTSHAMLTGLAEHGYRLDLSWSIQTARRLSRTPRPFTQNHAGLHG